MFAHGALPQTPLGAYSDPQLGNIGSHPGRGPHTIAGPRAPRPHDPPLCITFFDINPFLTVVIIRVPIRQHVFIPLQGPSKSKPKPKPKPSGSDIAAQAEKQFIKGSTKWSFTSCHWPGCNKNKCNSFVADMIKAAGITAPQRYVRVTRREIIWYPSHRFTRFLHVSYTRTHVYVPQVCLVRHHIINNGLSSCSPNDTN